MPKLKPTLRCMWFALCTRRAHGTQDHPALGKVPICRKCKAWYKKLGGQVRDAFLDALYPLACVVCALIVVFSW